MMQFTITCPASDSTPFNCDNAWILSLAEEDGELKILQVKQFSDPQEHITLDSARVAAKGVTVS
jgi:hypothetical protein